MTCNWQPGVREAYGKRITNLNAIFCSNGTNGETLIGYFTSSYSLEVMQKFKSSFGSLDFGS